MTDVGVVVLSMGDRPTELDRALRSLLCQRDVTLDVVVVGNGWEPVGLPEGVRAVTLADNVGVPAGRNVGAAAVDGRVLLFFDDDLELVTDDVVAGAVAAFDADARLGILQPRAVTAAGLSSGRRHVPRLRTADPHRGGDVVWFWEGCSFIRRTVFDAVGRWPGHFWYGHEGIEVGWRAIDLGYRVHYAADLTVVNPPAVPFRDPDRQRTDARNRVWVARRNLPHPVLEVYLAVWVLATLVRARDSSHRRAAVRGFIAGVREPAGERRPIRWRSVWRMTLLGRPPIV